MDGAGPVLIIVAKLLLMGPEGTRTLSEHRAGVPAGATGIIQENLDQPRLPATVRIHLTPAAAGAAESGANPPPLRVALRSELWRHPGQAASGSPPDEVNVEEIVLSPAGGTVVQIAEDPDGETRLVLSIAASSEGASSPYEREPTRGPPRPISFRVTMYRESAEGARELVSQHVLLTLEGRPVTWETTLRRPPLPSEGMTAKAEMEEGAKLALHPGRVMGGWISVEARLEAWVRPVGSEAGGSAPAASGLVRTVPVGIPFEIAIRSPAADSDAAAGQAARDAYVVEVTPYVPSLP